MRLATSILVLVIAGLASTCRLHDLVSPVRINSLRLTPVELLDSARAGSLALRTTTFALDIGAEAVPWSLRSVHGSTWLKPGDSAGTAPDTLKITLDPTGLVAGTYRDTLVFSIAGPIVAPVVVPVEFRVTGCGITDVTPGAPISDSLTVADCGAPHRGGRLARVYRVTGSANDSLTLQLTSAAVGACLVFDSGAAQAGIPSMVESGTCRPGQSGACLVYVRLPRAGSVLI